MRQSIPFGSFLRRQESQDPRLREGEEKSELQQCRLAPRSDGSKGITFEKQYHSAAALLTYNSLNSQYDCCYHKGLRGGAPGYDKFSS